MTTRGGPVSGTEALSLQGLPLDRMLLTRETQAELMDMAGNAMSSTVVCAIMLASLIAVYPILGAEFNNVTQLDDDEVKSVLIPSENYSLVRNTLQAPDTAFVNLEVLKSDAASTAVLLMRETDWRSRWNSPMHPLWTYRVQFLSRKSHTLVCTPPSPATRALGV